MVVKQIHIKMRLLLSILLICYNASVIAQQPIPSKQQSYPIALKGGIAHLGNGQLINNSLIVFESGKITSVEDFSENKKTLENYKVIDVSGKHIYPGFIAPITTLGLNEIEAVRATNDYREVGALNPNVRSIIAYNTDSKVTPTVRANGILLAQIVPEGGTISGQSSVVELDGWNWEDALYKEDIGIHLNWPRMIIYRGTDESQLAAQKENMLKEVAKIDALFKEAKAYSEEENHIETNLRLEAMKGLFNGSKKLFVYVNFVKEIIAAVNFCKKFSVKMVLVGGRDAWMITDLLKENNIPIIISKPHSLPSREDEDIRLPYKLPYILQEAGVLYCISGGVFWDQRNLAFNAGTAAAYGLSKEQVLMAITYNTAKILGIDSKVGTIEEGKDATLFVSSGEALDMLTNNVELAFIKGKELDLNNIQKELYSRYKNKYSLE